MIPSTYEFHWDLGHIVFLGVFYGIVSVAAVTLGVAVYRWIADLRCHRTDEIEWEEAFHSLPQERRRCRHEFVGVVPSRVCENRFDCESCSMHPLLAEAGRNAGTGDAGPAPLGLRLPENRFYHRAHTWAEPHPDGTFDVGIDDLALRCIGRPDRVVLPPPGTVLRRGERAVVVERGKFRVRVCAPIDGEVIELGDYEDGRLLRLRPMDPLQCVEHLLRGREARVWMLKEMESLQPFFGGAGEMRVAADGGQIVDDLMNAYPAADWDAIWGHLCLEP